MTATVSTDTDIHEHRWDATRAHVSSQARGVYLFHGLGEHAGCYDHVARWFAARGYQVGAHDHPGHGRSSGKRGVLESDEAIEQAAIEQFDRFSAEFDQTPLLVGHSLGGALAANLVLTSRLQPTGLILSAPAFEPAMTRWQQAQLGVMDKLARDVSVQARLSGPLLTHDEAMRFARQSDELIHHSVSARLLTWLVTAGAEALNLAPALSVRTWLLVPQEDVIVRPQASDVFAETAPAHLISHYKYNGLYHEIFNETPMDRDRVFSDIARWLDEHEY